MRACAVHMNLQHFQVCALPGIPTVRKDLTLNCMSVASESWFSGGLVNIPCLVTLSHTQARQKPDISSNLTYTRHWIPASAVRPSFNPISRQDTLVPMSLLSILALVQSTVGSVTLLLSSSHDSTSRKVTHSCQTLRASNQTRKSHPSPIKTLTFYSVSHLMTRSLPVSHKKAALRLS